ncbi:hypothetical protein [Gottfriedia acidiceleris]|uniref:hypothetical protein n=1 Tax=Gottfriedia acidiceleris TaxID=371036 RepID=UPI003D217838
MNERVIDNWFPGRWLGGFSLILGPIFMLIGVVLRSKFYFFFPDQLEAFKTHPTLLFFSYSFFIAGNVLLWPAVISLCKLISITKPNWALWGGSFAIFGLFARTFHAGVDHLAFQMVRILGVDTATKVMAQTYGSFHIFHSFSPLIMFGWIILAIGSYRAKVLGLIRSVLLGLMSSLPLGVLKGTTSFSILATLALCIALVPLGIRVLKDGPRPGFKKIIGSVILMLILLVGLFVIGELG